MTNVEFSNEFDVLFQNITSNQAPGLDEYEKSVFLTKAEKIIVRRQFDPNSDKLREGFDGSQQRQYDFSSIIRTENLKNISNHIDLAEKFDKRSTPFVWPLNYFLAVNEIIEDSKGQIYTVIPINYSQYSALMAKPYQYPPKRVAWRLLTDKKNTNYAEGIYLKGSDKYPYVINTSFGGQKRTLEINITKGTSTTTYQDPDVVGEIEFKESTDRVNWKKIITININGGNDDNGQYIYNVYLDDLLKYISNIRPDFNVWITESGEMSDESLGLEHGYQVQKEDDGEDVLNKYLDNFEDSEFHIKIKDLPENTLTIDTNLRTQSVAEIISGQIKSDNLITDYTLRYVKTPSPIVLQDFAEEGLSIDGVSVATECELPSECHQEILELAVSLAKVAMLGSTETLASSQNNKE